LCECVNKRSIAVATNARPSDVVCRIHSVFPSGSHWGRHLHLSVRRKLKWEKGHNLHCAQYDRVTWPAALGRE